MFVEFALSGAPVTLETGATIDIIVGPRGAMHTFACHAVGGRGGTVGPALDGVGSRFDQDYLSRWLNDPQSVRPGTAMPELPLTDEQVAALTTYLATLHDGTSAP